MARSGKTSLKGYTEEQIEDLLELQRNAMREKFDYFRDQIGDFPFLSLALAFVLGFAIGVALSPRSSKE